MIANIKTLNKGVSLIGRYVTTFSITKLAKLKCLFDIVLGNLLVHEMNKL